MSLFTKIYDYAMGPLEKYYIRRIRRKILKYAHGKVLEVGVGTGANFTLYPNDIKIVGIEPSEAMLKKARLKLDSAKVPIELIQGNAEQLPFADDSFDTVLVTLVLCSVKDLNKSLSELHRVLKPGGTVILFEHVRLDNPKWVGHVQDVFTPSWAFVCDGCRLNRNTIEEAKHFFEFDMVEKYFKEVFITAIGKKK